MTDRVYDVLARRYATNDTPWLFPTDDKTRCRKYPSKCVRNAMDNVGLMDCTIHTLRHTFASRLAIAGVSLQKIACMLGHSNTMMTERYAHLIPNEAARETVDVINLINSSR